MIDEIKICSEIFYIKRVARRKRCAVVIGDEGKFFLHVPSFMSDKEIKNCAERFIPPLVETLKKERTKKISAFHSYSDGDEFFCQGEKLKLKIDDTAREITRSGEYLIAPRIQSKEEANVLFYNFYAHLLSNLLCTRLKYWSQVTQLSPNNVTIKDVKTKWGSCSSKRNLNFNAKLAMLPPHLLDYIIVHELCHIKEMNHSTKFWQLVKKFLPKVDEYKLELKQNEKKYTW